MDGLTLLQKLQENDEKLSTIVVSAYGDMANIRTAMNRGAFDFLTKPIDFGDLETTITKTIRNIEILRDAHGARRRPSGRMPSLSRYFSPNLAAAALTTHDGAFTLLADNAVKLRLYSANRGLYPAGRDARA